jgi:hypothetical protein
MLLAVTALQAGVPVALLAWIARARPGSRLAWLTAAAATTAWIVAARLAGLWILLPPWLPLILFIALAGALLRGPVALRARPWVPRGAAAWAVGALFAAILGIGLWVTVEGSIGRRLPAAVPVVKLQFPMRDGPYYVANGGSTETLNPHLATLTAARALDVRGQSFAVDITRLRGDITGDAVFAPCGGQVVQVANDAPDEPTGRSDRARMAGNHVLLDCGDAQVLLAHMRRGSVAVQPGDSVTPRTRLGRAGNSGNSDVPHLHVHAQRAAAHDGAVMSGEPLHVRFDGRFLARNDIVDPAAAPTGETGTWTPTFMLYAQLGSILCALALLAVSLAAPSAGRLLFVALFAWAAQVNLRTALTTPEVYLDYAALADLDLYRRFIEGFFADHVTAIVGAIAVGQAAIAALLLIKGFPRVLGLAGAFVFLLAIVPLGVGSGFPATLIMAMAAAHLISVSH